MEIKEKTQSLVVHIVKDYLIGILIYLCYFTAYCGQLLPTKGDGAWNPVLGRTFMAVTAG